jgi:hypothetical protein
MMHAENKVTNHQAVVTRSHKANDRDHKGLAEGTAIRFDNMPRYFAKSGFVDVDPKKVKKDGNGRGNWYVLTCWLNLNLERWPN